MTTKTIAIIGAGFSGVATAANLLRLSQQPLRILLFEKAGKFAQGPAYATENPQHLLNVIAGNMSLWPDDRLHFVNWLKQSSQAQPYLNSHTAISQQYMPRLLFGTYLAESLAELKQKQQNSLELIPQAIAGIELAGKSYQLKSSLGEKFLVDSVVLATGNPPPKRLLNHLSRPAYINNPWDYVAIEAIPVDANVMIIGTGLTMIDIAITLAGQGHRGEVIAFSRRGLLPQVHTHLNAGPVLSIDALPHQLRPLMRCVRGVIAEQAEKGVPWQAVMRDLRPHIQTLWGRLSLTEQGRFLRHLRPYWDNHRHRIAPQIDNQIKQLQTQGQLRCLRAHLISANNTTHNEAHGRRIVVELLEHGKVVNSQLEVDTLINCTGPANVISSSFSTQVKAVEGSECPLFTDLLQQGLLQADALNLGIQVDKANRLIASSTAAPHPQRLYALGTPTRGQFWEVTAVPDLRDQCAKVAEVVCKDLI